MHALYRSIGSNVLLNAADSLVCRDDKINKLFESVALFKNVFYCFSPPRNVISFVIIAHKC